MRPTIHAFIKANLAGRGYVLTWLDATSPVDAMTLDSMLPDVDEASPLPKVAFTGTRLSASQLVFSCSALWQAETDEVGRPGVRMWYGVLLDGLSPDSHSHESVAREMAGLYCRWTDLYDALGRLAGSLARERTAETWARRVSDLLADDRNRERTPGIAFSHPLPGASRERLNARVRPPYSPYATTFYLAGLVLSASQKLRVGAGALRSSELSKLDCVSIPLEVDGFRSADLTDLIVLSAGRDTASPAPPPGTFRRGALAGAALTMFVAGLAAYPIINSDRTKGVQDPVPTSGVGPQVIAPDPAAPQDELVVSRLLSSLEERVKGDPLVIESTVTRLTITLPPRFTRRGAPAISACLDAVLIREINVRNLGPDSADLLLPLNAGVLSPTCGRTALRMLSLRQDGDWGWADIDPNMIPAESGESTLSPESVPLRYRNSPGSGGDVDLSATIGSHSAVQLRFTLDGAVGRADVYSEYFDHLTLDASLAISLPRGFVLEPRFHHPAGDEPSVCRSDCDRRGARCSLIIRGGSLPHYGLEVRWSPPDESTRASD
ncbi:MAG: hypothetical protein HY049_03725 [Acidobacteria bacterium]|nr:hypothetical protein [Acidobacteriota bacterium]